MEKNSKLNFVKKQTNKPVNCINQLQKLNFFDRKLS